MEDPLTDGQLFSPVVDKEGLILVADSQARLYIFTQKGKLKYMGYSSNPDDNSNYSNSISFKSGYLSISNDGKVYLSSQGILNMFDTENWTESELVNYSAWSQWVGDDNLSEVIIGGDGSVYAAFLLAPYEIDFRLKVLDGSGSSYYSDIMGSIIGSPILTFNGNIFFCTDDGDLICATPDGKVISTEKVADSITTRPVPGPAGELYIGIPGGLKSLNKRVVISQNDPWLMPGQNFGNSACCVSDQDARQRRY